MLAYIMLIARTISTFEDTQKAPECFVEAYDLSILDNADLLVHLVFLYHLLSNRKRLESFFRCKRSKCCSICNL